ncbi:MAG: hypothetical protein WC346_19765, partial [Methanogenium sp.]
MEIRNFKQNDEYYTPRYAVMPLLKYLKPNSIIWCPFDTENSQYVKVFNEFNHTVVYSHIDEGDDFFNTICNCDYIISNPPYSLKYEVLLRLYELNKPFAMLLGSHGIFEAKRFKLFSQNNF